MNNLNTDADDGVSILHNANILEKGINPIILPSVMGKL